MSYLLDTNVISEIRRGRDRNVAAWAGEVTDPELHRLRPWLILTPDLPDSLPLTALLVDLLFVSHFPYLHLVSVGRARPARELHILDRARSRMCSDVSLILLPAKDPPL